MDAKSVVRHNVETKKVGGGPRDTWINQDRGAAADRVLGYDAQVQEGVVQSKLLGLDLGCIHKMGLSQCHQHG